MIEATQAQKAAAEYAKRTARYTLWSVLALAVTSAISATIQILAWLYPRH